MQGAVMSCELACLYFQLASGSGISCATTIHNEEFSTGRLPLANVPETERRLIKIFIGQSLVKSPQKPTRWSVPVSRAGLPAAGGTRH